MLLSYKWAACGSIARKPEFKKQLHLPVFPVLRVRRFQLRRSTKRHEAEIFVLVRVISWIVLSDLKNTRIQTETVLIDRSERASPALTPAPKSFRYFKIYPLRSSALAFFGEIVHDENLQNVLAHWEL